MNLNCPHCGHDFELAADGEFDTATDCPKCGSSVPVGPQSSIDIEFSFDLDGAFSDSGLSEDAIDAGASVEDGDQADPVDLSAELAVFEETPKPPPLPPAAKPDETETSEPVTEQAVQTEVEAGSRQPLAMGAGSSAADELSAGVDSASPGHADSEMQGDEDVADTNEEELEPLTERGADSEDEDSPIPSSDGLGFDEHEPEVSQLADLDLNMTGTYHRASRALHHATDVVFSKGAASATDTTSEDLAPPAPPDEPSEDVPFDLESQEPDRSAVQSAPTQAAFDAVSADEVSLAMGETVAADALNPLELDSQGSIEDEISALFEADALDAMSGDSDAFESVDSSADASALLSSDEVDFDSLLDEDSLSGIKMFDESDNPFTDRGDEDPPVTATPDEASASYQSDDETNAFFVDAPVAEPAAPEAAGDMDLDLSDAYEVDLPADLSQLSPPPVDPLPKPSSEKPAAKPKKKASKPNVDRKQVVALAGLLTLLVGAGVVGEALGHGWFFMKLMDEPPAAPPPPPPSEPAAPQQATAANPNAAPSGQVSPGQPATGEPAPAQVVVPKPNVVQDTSPSYVAAIAELKQKVAANAEDAAAKDKLVRLQLRYRYRWPGRYQRHAEIKPELQASLAAGAPLSSLAQFWDLMSRTSTSEERPEILKKAELALAQVPASTFEKGRDLFFKGLLFVEQGKTDNAASLVGLAVAETPDDSWALYTRAQLFVQAGKLDEAKAALEHLLAKTPNHVDGRLLLAQVAIGRQTPAGYALARDLAKKALADSKSSKDAYGTYLSNLKLAVVYGLQNDLVNRLKSLEGAAKFNPKDETLLLELAENDLKKGDAKTAVERLKKCGKGVCTSVRYYKTHLKALFVNHQLAEAEKLVKEAEKAHSEVPELVFWSAKVFEARGKILMAARRYKEVKKLDSKYLEAYLRLAGIHRRKKEFESAIRVLDEATLKFEGGGSDSAASLALAQERGELLVKQGRLDQAREVFSKIVSTKSENGVARFRLARILTELGFPQKAVTHFEKLYAQGWTDPEVNIHFAQALILSGKPDRAIEELKTFLVTNPNSLPGLVKLGHAFVQKQRYEEAMAVLERAVAIKQDYAPAYFFAGMAELGRQRQKAELVERKERNGEVVRGPERPNFKKSIIALTTATEKDKQTLKYREMLAQALTEQGADNDLKAALEQYDHIIKEYRTRAALGHPVKRRAEVYYRRGLLASKLGLSRPEILKNFQDALELDTDRADYIARYAEELYRLQVRSKVGKKYVPEAKAYFELVLSKHNVNHVTANYYMGRIVLLEWDKQRDQRPGDRLHNKALVHFERVIKHNGIDQFPSSLMAVGNIFKDRRMNRLAVKYYQHYLRAYRRIHSKDPSNARYVRDLIRQLR